jgi:hypothetical protein
MDFLETQIFGNVRLGFAFTVWISGMIFTWTYEKRSHFWLRSLLGLAVFLVLAYFAPDYLLWGWFLTAVYYIFFLYAAYIVFCCKGTAKDLLFAIAGSFSIQDIGSHVCAMLRKITPDYFWAKWWVGIAAYASVFLICYFLFVRRIKRGDKVRIQSTILLFISLVSILIGTLLGQLERIYKGENNLLLTISIMIIRVMSLVILFAEYGRWKEKFEKQTIEQLMAKEQEHYGFVKSNIDSINAKCHNIKYQIQAIQAESNDKAKDESLNKLMGEVDVYDSIPKTKNSSLDSIMTEKCLYCEKHQIKFTYMVQGEKLDFMRPIDIYTLFGNALDNALECVIKYKDKEKRIISLNVSAKGDFLRIHLENYCEEPLSFADGLPTTSKEDKDNHGLGLKSIKYIAESYQGNMTVRLEDSMFKLNVLIPLNS